MKKLLLSAVVIFAIKASAQPTLTSAIIPHVGTSVTFMYHDTAGIFPGSGGPNQTWTFNVINTAPNTLTYVDTGSTPYSSLFPLSNIAYPYGTDTYAYAAVNSGAFAFFGFKGPGVELILNDEEQTVEAAMTYQELVSDIHSGTFTFGTNTGTRTGLSDIYYDSYGTLVLNGTTYSNVARVFLEENFDDVGTSGTVTSHVENFLWYDANTMKLLFEINTTYIGGNITSKFVKSYDVGVGVSEQPLYDVTVALIPSITHNEDALVSIEGLHSSHVTLRVTDAIGKIIMLEPLKPGSGLRNFTIPCSGFQRGFYIVSVLNGSGEMVAVRRLAVQ